MKRIISALALLILIGQTTIAQELLEENFEAAFDLSLEELMNMEVTSVSKKAERLQDVASAIYVVTSDDIIKSGATTLHEVLRTVPGYYGVQESYSSVYASIRNSPTPNAGPGTVLYLLDGTPIQDLMGSVFSFENFDIPLDEIDRIEVIKGSGGTVYGANSATGVINIFTKDPEDYDGINTRIEGADPGYVAVSLRTGGKVSDKVAISGYAKFRSFSGWGSLAGKDEDGNSTVSTSAFTEDSDESTYYSFGTKFNFEISEDSKLSARLHYNGRQRTVYTSVFDENFIFTRDDVLIENDVTANRFVANLRYDHSFNEDHSLFIRASTNRENDFYRIGGGMDISNSIVDFEVQDNLSLGDYNDLTFGANFRLVNFDVHNINSESFINYVDPQANETINGVFFQDKIKLMDERLNFTIGIKAENYSLIDDKYYLSPMAKIAFKASDKITLWGGYTRSFTTPGFENSNIDFFLFQTPSPAAWTQVLTPAITPQVEAVVYQGVYDQAIAGGADAATADGIATAFITSPVGVATIQAGTTAEIQNVIDGTPNVAVKNGSQTVPTKFETIEIGAKTSLGDKVQLSATIFKTFIKDGISVNPGNQLQAAQSSITNSSRTTDYYLYGNYVKGESNGLELVIKVFPTSGLLLEGSLSMNKTEYEYQENADFDIANFVGETPASGVPFMPEQVFRFKANYEFGSGFNASASILYASEYSTEANYVYERERYANIIEGQLPVLDPSNNPTSTIVAKNDSRSIINLRIEKKFMDDKLSIYGFGNDITNSGIVADTDNLRNTTLNQIGAMYGLGLNYKFK